MNALRQQRFSIRDVARLADVSPATVSRVLSGTANVRPETRERVLTTVEALGYRPNRTARNLRRQQSAMVGVVVSDIENPHFTEMVRAIEDAAYGNGYRVLLCNTDEDPVKQADYLGVLAAERVVGVILSPTDAHAPEISELLDHGIHVVAFDRTVADPRADAVVAGNLAGVRLGVQHLLEIGHTNIGYIGGPPTLETSDQRLRGYREAMSAAHLEPRTSEGGFRIDGGGIAAAALLDEGVSALVVANNLMAIGALQTVRDRGLRIPHDVAVLSVDDPFWASVVTPPLTTLAQPIRAMAQAAVGLLVDRVAESEHRRKRLVFDFEFRHRGSCCQDSE